MDKDLEIIKSKVLGSMLGGAIGDAMGYQIEFDRGIKEREVTKYKNNFGMISDDTQMSLFTANSLIWCSTRFQLRGIGPNLPVAMHESYLDWLDCMNGKEHKTKYMRSWIKDVDGLKHSRAPGRTCISSLMSGKMGTIEEPINDSKGCGGVMRVAPIGLSIDITRGGVGIAAAENNAITHGHPLGIISSYILATMISNIVYENSDIEDALNKAIEKYKNESVAICDKENEKLFFDLINKAIVLSKTNISDLQCIKELGEGWVAEETLAISLYSCLKHKDNFIDAIICAVNHDGDSDSTGAVAGNIIGALLGYKAIPEYYINNLELKDLIIEIATDLATPCPLDEFEPIERKEDIKWWKKYGEEHYDFENALEDNDE